jgi:zinc and cadmium transporter
MFHIYLYSLLSVIIVSLLSLIGIFTFLMPRLNMAKLTMFLVSLSAGALLGDSFLHLLPEAVKKDSGQSVWLWLLGGIMTFFILEKIIHWRHCHQPTTASHQHPVGIMNLIGGSLHNFIDGLAIAGSFLISFELGLATTIAVISHEIPRELGDYGILIYAGYSKYKALFFNFLSAAASIIGALTALIIGGQIQGFTGFIAPFTAGGFIYIAASDLFPELKKDCVTLKHSFLQLISILIGIGIMMALK